MNGVVGGVVLDPKDRAKIADGEWGEEYGVVAKHIGLAECTLEVHADSSGVVDIEIRDTRYLDKHIEEVIMKNPDENGEESLGAAFGAVTGYLIQKQNKRAYEELDADEVYEQVSGELTCDMDKDIFHEAYSQAYTVLDAAAPGGWPVAEGDETLTIEHAINAGRNIIGFGVEEYCLHFEMELRNISGEDPSLKSAYEGIQETRIRRAKEEGTEQNFSQKFWEEAERAKNALDNFREKIGRTDVDTDRRLISSNIGVVEEFGQRLIENAELGYRMAEK